MVNSDGSLTSATERLARSLGRLAMRDAPLGARTTYRVGGNAALLVEATDYEALVACHRALAAVGSPVPVVVIGKGSNMLVSDRGFPGLAICLAGAFGLVEIEGTTVRAGGAVGMQALARKTADLGLSGFEWAVGIPGSLGGAVRMNAGGHGSQMADVLTRARVFDLESGSARWFELAELDTGYRRSAVRDADVVVSTELSLRRSEPKRAAEALGEVVRWRVSHQPGGLNSGSVFTNPPDDSAGRLIDATGLKGLRIRSAEVSRKHANFFQADRHGSADDVMALIEKVRSSVREAQGVDLVPELKMIGFSQDDPRPFRVSTSTSGSESLPRSARGPTSGTSNGSPL
jgi:UDP-N-acetylmuramate dehydrogenase